MHGHDTFNQNFQKFWSKTELIGSVQPEMFRIRVGPPRKVDHFSRLDRSDRILTFPMDHGFRPLLNSSASLFGIFYVQHGGKTYHCSFWTVNSGSIGVTRTCAVTCFSSGCSCFASQVYVLAIKNNIYPGRISNVLFVILKWCLNSYGK